MSIAQCTAIVAPYYNLGLVIILSILFIKLFRSHTQESFTKPWYLLFGAIVIFIIEEVLTVLRGLGIISYPAFINPIFEMMMISLFIYMLLIQKQHIQEHY